MGGRQHLTDIYKPILVQRKNIICNLPQRSSLPIEVQSLHVDRYLPLLTEPPLFELRWRVRTAVYLYSN